MLKWNRNIAVIDTGIDVGHPVFDKSVVHCYRCDNSKVRYMKEGCGDSLGHGTGVCSIIVKECPNAELYVYRVFDEEYNTTQEQLITALKHIREMNICEIIHMSLGVDFYSEKLEQECKLLESKGRLIISAFDNYGAVSFPASFDCVIGVDIDPECQRRVEYRYYEDNIIDVGVKGGNFRTADLKMGYCLNQGTSFAAAFFTGFFANRLFDGCLVNGYRELIKKYAYKTIQCNKCDGVNQRIPFTISRAAVFPYNKEIHSVVNFKDLLCFDIVHVYDIKYSGCIGRKKSNIFGENLLIENITTCSLSDIDTIIIGQLDKIISILGKDFLKTLAEKIIAEKLNVYCFDNSILEFFTNYPEDKIYFVDNIKYCRNHNKLYRIEKPVIGVMGTTSIQGKFTLQLGLRKSFMEKNYSVGQLGTEPSSLLFGFDFQYLYGYGIGEERINYAENTISLLNAMIHHMDVNDKEIIIVGAQSGTIPLMYDNIGQLPLRQQEFLLGTSPDYVVLCVNLYDDFEYIQRSINYIESLSESEVLALAVNPLCFKNEWQQNNDVRIRATDRRIEEFMQQLEGKFKRKSFLIGDMLSVEKLTDYLIENLSEIVEE